MTSAYDGAIAALKGEIASLATALRVLERLRDEHTGGDVVVDAPFITNGDKPRNEDAIEAIMVHSFPKYLGITDIVSLGPAVGGRDLNKNSVRWVVKHAVDAGHFEKKKEGGRAWYRLKK